MLSTLVFLIPLAGAQGLESLRSEATSGLFRDAIDFVPMPALLVHQDLGELYTGLHAVENGSLLAGYVGARPAGAFALGVQAAGTGELIEIDHLVSSSSEVHRNRPHTEVNNRELALQFALAHQEAQRSWGFGLWAYSHRTRNIVEDNEEVYGYYALVDEMADGAAFQGRTVLREDDTQIGGSLGWAWQQPARQLALTLRLGAEQSRWREWSKAQLDGSTITAHGSPAIGYLSADHWLVAPGISVEGRWQLPRQSQLRIGLDGQSSAYAPWDRYEVRTDGTSTHVRRWQERYLSALGLDNALQGIALYEVQVNDLDLRVGATGLRAATFRRYHTQEGPPASQTDFTSEKVDRALRFPLALEAPVAGRDTVVLRAATTWSISSHRYRSAFGERTSEADPIVYESQTFDTSNDISLGAGLRPNPALRLDLACFYFSSHDETLTDSTRQGSPAVLRGAAPRYDLTEVAATLTLLLGPRQPGLSPDKTDDDADVW